jgi:hypothetical protein
MDQFLTVLRDKDNGRAYRTYAGITMVDIPTKGTFSIFKNRLGETLYNEIFHVLVDIFEQLEMITYKIMAHDGTLFPSRAKYKGCNHFSPKCLIIKVPGFIDRVRKQVIYRLNNLHKINLDKTFKIKADCPCDTLPEDMKRPKIEMLVMKLGVIDGSVSQDQNNTAILFGVKEQLDKQGLYLKVIRSNLAEIAPDMDKAIFRCHKIPTDMDARIGVRRDPKNPAKKQKIFGYNMIFSTSVELDLKLELPVAVVNMAGNGKEGEKIIDLTKQARSHHDCIEDNPRLLNEIPRGTKRYNDIKRCRSAAERSNSTLKETLHIIEKPIVYSRQRADILVQIAAIALLLYKAFSFIVKISLLVMKYRENNDPAIEKKLQLHDIPKSIRNIIQRE